MLVGDDDSGALVENSSRLSRQFVEKRVIMESGNAAPRGGPARVVPVPSSRQPQSVSQTGPHLVPTCCHRKKL